MSRVTFTEVDSEPDALDQVNFRLFFPNLPGIDGSSSASLEINAQQVVWAGSSNEAFEVTRHGWTKSYRGRKTFPRTFSLSFVEVGKADVSKTLKKVLEYTAGSESNNSQEDSTGYKFDAILEIYTTTGEVAHAQTFTGTMIQDVQDATLDGNSSGQVTISATFKYDNIKESDIPVL